MATGFPQPSLLAMALANNMSGQGGMGAGGLGGMMGYAMNPSLYTLGPQIQLGQQLESEGVQNTPLQSPWQGLSRLASAIVGRHMIGNATAGFNQPASDQSNATDQEYADLMDPGTAKLFMHLDPISRKYAMAATIADVMKQRMLPRMQKPDEVLQAPGSPPVTSSMPTQAIGQAVHDYNTATDPAARNAAAIRVAQLSQQEGVITGFDQNGQLFAQNVPGAVGAAANLAGAKANAVVPAAIATAGGSAAAEVGPHLAEKGGEAGIAGQTTMVDAPIYDDGTGKYLGTKKVPLNTYLQGIRAPVPGTGDNGAGGLANPQDAIRDRLSGNAAPPMSQIGTMIESSAQAHGVPPALLHQLVGTESGGDPNAVNRASGATGLGQVLPSTAANPGYGIPPLTNLKDAGANLDFSARYLRTMHDITGSWVDAVHRYGTFRGQPGTPGQAALLAAAQAADASGGQMGDQGAIGPSGTRGAVDLPMPGQSALTSIGTPQTDFATQAAVPQGGGRDQRPLATLAPSPLAIAPGASAAPAQAIPPSDVTGTVPRQAPIDVQPLQPQGSIGPAGPAGGGAQAPLIAYPPPVLRPGMAAAPGIDDPAARQRFGDRQQIAVQFAQTPEQVVLGPGAHPAGPAAALGALTRTPAMAAVPGAIPQPAAPPPGAPLPITGTTTQAPGGAAAAAPPTEGPPAGSGLTQDQWAALDPQDQANFRGAWAKLHPGGNGTPPAAIKPPPATIPPTSPIQGPMPEKASIPGLVPGESIGVKPPDSVANVPGVTNDFAALAADQTDATNAQADIQNATAIQDYMQKVKMGRLGEVRQDAAGLAKALGVSEQELSGYLGTDVAAGDFLKKKFLEQAANAERKLGARPAASVLMLYTKTYPNIETQPEAADLQLNVLKMNAIRAQERATAERAWINRTAEEAKTTGSYKGLEGFNDDFNKVHPTEAYLGAAEAMSPPTGTDKLPRVWLRAKTLEQKKQIMDILDNLPPGGDWTAWNGTKYPVGFNALK